MEIDNAISQDQKSFGKGKFLKILKYLNMDVTLCHIKHDICFVSPFCYL